MSATARLGRPVLAALTAWLLIGAPMATVGATAQTTPESTTPAPPLTLELDPMGDLASGRLAKARGVMVAVNVSAPATVRVELLMPRSVARALKVKVPAGATRVVVARRSVTASQAGYVITTPQFSRAIAKRLAAKPRSFTLLVAASSGSVRVTTPLAVKRRD